MIVGTKDISPYAVKKHCTSITALRDYCEVLVPRVLRHIKPIVNNQKYIVALVVRNISSIPYKERKELCEELLSDVAVTGVINEIYDFEDIMYELDIDLLTKFISENRSVK